jgi:hypothetical protein
MQRQQIEQHLTHKVVQNKTHDLTISTNKLAQDILVRCLCGDVSLNTLPAEQCTWLSQTSLLIKFRIEDSTLTSICDLALQLECQATGVLPELGHAGAWSVKFVKPRAMCWGYGESH